MVSNRQRRNFEAIERGSAALAFSPHLKRFIEDRRLSIVRNIVAMYKANRLTTDRLWGAAGALNELDDQLHQVENLVTGKILAEQDERGSSAPED